MRLIPVSLAFLLLPWPALGHHSITAFYDQDRRVEIEGTVTEVFWRNPHTGFTIEVVNDAGEIEEWTTEGNTTSQLVRNGFTRDSVKVGDRIRAAGRASRRGERMIFGSPSHVILPSGEAVALRTTPSSADETELASAADAAGSGFFKVWSFETRYQLRNPFVLTPAAQAALETYDASLQCIPPGMPNAILNPYPIELIDEGDRIILRIEEWSQERVIHMTEAARGQTPAPSHLGYSVGRWEGGTLVVDITRLSFPFLDQDGRPMSENASMRERFTMNEDERELHYEVVITDPEYLVEPAIWDHTWYYEPGDEFLPGIEEGERFECEMQGAEDSVYR